MSSEMRPHIVVAACIVSEGYVLLTKRDKHLKRGEWELPGGQVHLGERLEDALMREIEEELGWLIVPTRLVHAQVNTYSDTGEDYLVLYYECLSSQGNEFPLLPRVESRWIGHTAALEGLFCLPGTKEAMSKALKEGIG